MPELYTYDKAKRPVYIQIKERLDGSIIGRLVNEDGEPCPGGMLFHISADGALTLHLSVNPDAARRAGIKLDHDGRIVVA